MGEKNIYAGPGSAYNPFDAIFQEISLLRQELAQKELTGSVEIITRQELCKRLDVTEQTIIRLERKGKIPTIRVAGACRYNFHDVIKALETKGRRC